jgi:hypothetical protein
VRVQITTEPADAELFLDGQPIPSPFDGDLPSGTELHRIEARATGYVTETREVSLAFPQRLRIELVREGRRPSGERPRGEPTAHEEPARTEPTATVRPEPAIEAPPTEPAHEAPPADLRPRAQASATPSVAASLPLIAAIAEVAVVVVRPWP